MQGQPGVAGPLDVEESTDTVVIVMETQQTGPMPAQSGARVAIHELSRNRRIGILLICSMSLLIVGLDVTIVNVALPSIGRELHASVSGLQWVVDAYTLVLASLLMLSGSTADGLAGDGRSSSASRSSPPGRCFAAWRPAWVSSLCSACSRQSAGPCSTRSPCPSSRTRSPIPASGHRQWVSGVRSSASRWRWGPSWGDSSSRRPDGGLSFGSTSPSEWPRSSSPCATSPSQRRRAPGVSTRSVSCA